MKYLTLLLVVIIAAPAWAGGITSLKDGLYDRYEIDLAGFIEARGGYRLHEDPYEKDYSLAETRLQVDLSKDMGWGIAKFKGDVLADQVMEETDGLVREANLLFTPLSAMDIKVGRQVLTWGTGDLLFINDLFPKDWQAFFIGRDDEYLKAPSDAIKASYFTDLVNVNLVWTPVFGSSNHISGERLSYWNSLLGRTAGRDYIFAVEERNSLFDDSEVALRLSKNVGSLELALYGYWGFWKEPEGMAMQPVRLIYPRLNVYGGSLRSPLAKGIANLEMGYYDSSQDRGGDNPLIRNSEFRLLTGYEQELTQDFTGAVQYYLEYLQDYEAYKQGISDGRYRDKFRHLLTMRLTKLLLNQNLILSLFCYYSPNDHDGYLRIKSQYKLDDHWLLEAGANIFAGQEDYTFWGQFEDNSNIYAGARWSF